MGPDISKQSNKEHILLSVGTGQNHRREREESKPCQWGHLTALCKMGRLTLSW